MDVTVCVWGCRGVYWCICVYLEVSGWGGCVSGYICEYLEVGVLGWSFGNLKVCWGDWGWSIWTLSPLEPPPIQGLLGEEVRAVLMIVHDHNFLPDQILSMMNVCTFLPGQKHQAIPGQGIGWLLKITRIILLLLLLLMMWWLCWCNDIVDAVILLMLV